MVTCTRLSLATAALRIVSLLVAMAIVTPLDAETTFRLFGSAGAEAQHTPANEDSPLNPDNVGRVPDRTSLGDASVFLEAMPDDRSWKARVKLRGDASDRGNDSTEIGEALLQVSAAGWLDITAGRVIEKWGTGYAWNPTAFIGPRKSPSDPGDRRSSYRGIDMVKADVFVKDTAVSLYRLRDGDYAARAYRLVHGIDGSLYLRGGDDPTQYGFSLAKVFGNALELHAEVARSDGFVKALAGGQYTFRNGINLVVELYHDDEGLSRRAWASFRELVGTSEDPFDLREANLRYQPLRMARDYAFVRLHDGDLWRGVEAELIAITNLRDASTLVRLSLSHRITPNISLYVIDTEFMGSEGSEFAYVQIERVTTLGFRIHF
ncbi:MAG TPA: hypothetical protein VMT00_12415 [Thermoanaerobaculia bacterium]|nr:hypothetical protein [Thermoanaerobaculia bacterium]